MNEEELPKAYDPKPVEEKWYSYWELKGYFKADAKSLKPSFTISIPPPNVTGSLHMGHALVDTIQDILIRWKRMSGFEVLWVPGTDHAGIATQTVVERNLIAKFGKRRKDFSRQEFLEIVWKWKNESEKTILNQLKRLGCSCDWSRYAFTMDEKRSHAVKVVFKKMFDENLIYRGDYLVNWDYITQTALADDEVEYEERDSFLWYLRYPLQNSSDFIVVATTRPETMLGDTAVAVNPDDTRYKHLIGKKARLPLSNRMIPIIEDHLIDPNFGTGAVKITPAHDSNDYQMAMRHGLEMINIMTPDGKINEKGGIFQGLPMEEARLAVIKKIEELGLLEKKEKHFLRVGVSYRSKAIIEPYLSKQWFVKMQPFKEKLISAVRDKRVKIIPEHWEATYFHWIENLRDWCISRQLWWGHQIPVWYHKKDPEKMICSSETLPPEVQKNPEEWVQDPDVLDTWFSSALWPFSILGWPEKTDDLKKFYPNSVLVTGHDILFFWVARMILMGEYITHEVPFKETFLHGLIYGKSYWRYQKDGSLVYLSGEERLALDLGGVQPKEVHFKWEKMSKSKGNIIDPLEIIETYGTDSMRLALCASCTFARQIDLDRRRFEDYKNFINKIWNGARFVFLNIENIQNFDSGLNQSLLTLEDRWIFSRLNQIIKVTNQNLHSYAFDRAATQVYDFFWKEFCAYYLELVKPVLFGKVKTPEDKQNKQKILCIILSNVIRLLHPMAPFITEELFQLLKKQLSSLSFNQQADLYTQETVKALSSPSCMISKYPEVIAENDINLEIEEAFAFMERIVYAVRNIRAEMQLAPNIETNLYVIGKKNDHHIEQIKEHQAIIFALTRTKEIYFQEKEPSLGLSASAPIGNILLTIPLPDHLKEKEKLRLTKERDKLIEQANLVKEKLSNQEFLQKAPPPLIEKFKHQFHQTEKELLEVMKKLKVL